MANTENTALSNEEILNELHNLYVNPINGLISIGKQLGLHLFAPRRKVNVMLIGNHSSGKSSFINWYVDTKVQKTGVAIETQGFTVVTCGKHRKTLTGKATLHLYPHLKPLESIKGVLPYLNTELTPSNSRQFNLVNFIDTPGLADGELHYPYDIDKAILAIGDIADLIFVFFDPVGQALCSRTLNLVEKLNHLYSERMHYFLSKADEAGYESDRQKVMMQIVQELCKRQGLNQCGFDMFTIYIPNHTELKLRDKMCVNQIEDTCKVIENTIALTIQNTFNTMEKDIDQLEELAQTALTETKRSVYENFRNVFKLVLTLMMAIQFPLACVLYPAEIGDKVNQSKFSNYFSEFTLVPAKTLLLDPWLWLSVLPNSLSFYLFWLARFLSILLPRNGQLLCCCLLSFLVLLVFRPPIRFKHAHIKNINKMNDILNILRSLHRFRKKQLFSNYLHQMVYDIDID